VKKSEIILFETKDKEVTLSVPMDGDTVWLTQAQMTELFNVDRPVQFYSLDVIISVGYRVKSKRGIEFRQWASKILN